MGVLYQFHFIVGVPAELLADSSGRPLLETAKARAAQEFEDEADQDVVKHLNDLLPEPLHAYEGGAHVYGGKQILVVGKAVLKLNPVKGLTPWDMAGPLGEEAFKAAQREVTEALAALQGARDPRAILLCHTY